LNAPASNELRDLRDLRVSLFPPLRRNHDRILNYARCSTCRSASANRLIRIIFVKVLKQQGAFLFVDLL
jgi:hypothetical protein